MGDCPDDCCGSPVGEIWIEFEVYSRCDLNRDADVDLQDFGVFDLSLAGPGHADYGPTDFDADGDTDLQDFSFMQLNFDAE